MKIASIIFLIFMISTVSRSLAQTTVPVVVVIGQAEDCPTVTGLEESVSMIEVYPNPAKHSLTIKTIVPIGKIQLMDMHGRQVITKQIDSPVNQIDISDLSPGLYILRLKHQHGDELMKIKIQ